MKTRKGEKEKLRTEILEKAVAYLKRHGYGASSTDKMMTFIGLTRGALYSHFKSKDDLFAQAICADLKRLEESIRFKIEHYGPLALARIIDEHLSERSLVNVENSCVFTSLSSDMQRSKAIYRGKYEDYIERIYAMFAQAFQEIFPDDSPERNAQRAVNLYSMLVGTLTMARTMKDPEKALGILAAGRETLHKEIAPL